MDLDEGSSMKPFKLSNEDYSVVDELDFTTEIQIIHVVNFRHICIFQIQHFYRL